MYTIQTNQLRRATRVAQVLCTHKSLLCARPAADGTELERKAETLAQYCYCLQ